jgi:hypothetical protein
MSSFSYRQKNGEQSTFSASIPGISYVESINDRQDGDIIIEIYKNGSYLGDFVEMNFENLVPNYGTNKKSIMLYGEKQVSYIPIPATIPLTGIYYYAPNRTNGKRTYHSTTLIEHLTAGDTVSYEDYEFTLGEIQYNASKDRLDIYYKEV